MPSYNPTYLAVQSHFHNTHQPLMENDNVTQMDNLYQFVYFVNNSI